MTQHHDGASQQAVSGDLATALNAANVDWRELAADDASFVVDGVRPSLLCTPASVDQLAGAVRAAGATGAAVIPWGGGTRMSLGHPPRAADLVIQTTALDEIVEYEPADLTVTIQAGMTLAALQERLRAEGQMLALDPAAADRATIGGLIAANASGPLRFMYGAARDLVIGTRVVNADGVVSKAGGRVVKNVAGYDLNKLYVGSLGTVGLVVELSFKLHPLPQNQGLLLAAFDRVEDAAAAVAALVRSPLGPAALELLDGPAAAGLPGAPALAGDGVLLVVAALGFEKAVERQLADITSLCAGASGTTAVREGADLDGIWTALREFSDPSATDVALLKLAVPPARGAVALDAARAAARDAGLAAAVQAHAGSGVVYARLAPEAWDASTTERLAGLLAGLRGYARGEGGSLVVEACPWAAKAPTGPVDPWGDVGSGFPVMRTLKENLDPRGTLNPGRFVGGL